MFNFLNLFSSSSLSLSTNQLQADPSRVHRLLRLPPSSTGLCGVISVRTLRELAEIRRGKKCFLVIVTGARMTTLCRRLPFLPACDAVAAEGGGRLFWTSGAFPRARGGAGAGGSEKTAEEENDGRRGREEEDNSPPPTLCDLREDTAWRLRHAAAAGPPSANEGVPPAKREGPLWDAYRRLEAEGWAPDASGYSTSFRLPLRSSSSSSSSSSPASGSSGNNKNNRQEKTERDLDLALRSLPPCLSSSRNLGCADVFPSTSGKEAVGRYVAAALGVSLRENCAFLCDDDNDLPLAAAVGRAFVVGATHPSVERAIAEEEAKGEKGHFWTTGLEGTLAADAAVEAAGRHLREVCREEGEERKGKVAAEKAERAPAFA